MESRIKELEKRVTELEAQSHVRAWPDMKVDELRNFQKTDLTFMANSLGVNVTALNEKELLRFGRSYTRQLRLDDIHLRHQKEALLGAMIAKHQFGERVVIGGEIPAQDQLQGPVTIRARWFGLGDGWYDKGPWVRGKWNPWIDIVVHDAVHLVYGVQALLEKTLIEAVQFTIDGVMKAVQQTRFTEIKRPGQLKIREFDSAYIFKENTVVKVNVFLSNVDPLDYPPALDYPKLYGVSFVPYKTALETQDSSFWPCAEAKDASPPS